MTASTPRCRECDSTENVAFFNVVRDGGDEYPWTALCEEHADEYASDSNVESIRLALGEPQRSLTLTYEEAEYLARLLAYNLWCANGDKEIGDPIFTQIVTIFDIEGEMEDLASGI